MQIITNQFITRDKMQSEQKYYKILAEYFYKYKLGIRKVKELPWLLTKSREWSRLSDIFSELSFLHLAWRSDRLEIKEFWTNIETIGGLNPYDAYKPFINNPTEKQIGFYSDIVELLTETGHIHEAIPLLEYRVQYYRKERFFFQLIWCISEYAIALKEIGKFEPALTAFREQERLALEAGHYHEYCTSLGNQAAIQMLQSNFDIALNLLKKQEASSQLINDQYNLCVYLNNQSLVQRYLDDSIASWNLLIEFEKLTKYGDKELLYTCEFNKGILLYDSGEYDQAYHNFESVLQKFTLFGNKNKMAIAIGNLALIALRKGDSARAIELLNQQESICTINQDQVLLACLCNKALVLMEQKHFSQAMNVLLMVEDLSRKYAIIEGIVKSMMYQAAILILQNGSNRKAEALLAEANDLAKTHKLLNIRKELDKISDIEQFRATSGLNVQGWVVPIILMSSLSSSRSKVIIPRESQVVIPDWSIMDESDIHSFILNGGDPNLLDKDGGTALMAASLLNAELLVIDLLQLHVNVNIQDNNGITALMVAANKGRRKIVQLLLNSKAETNIQQKDGVTALLSAIKSNDIELVNLLLKHGANPNLKTNLGITPLMLAVINCNKEIVKDLLHNSADPHIKLNDGRTAIDFANEECPGIKDILLEISA